MEFPAKGKLKYIVFEEGRFAVIFPSFLNHSDVKKSLGRLMFNVNMYGPPTSAGYCYIDSNGQWATYADSVTLGLESQEEDDYVLNEWYPTG